MPHTVSRAVGRCFELLFGTIKRVRPHRPLHPRGLRLEGVVVVEGNRGASGVSWIDSPGTGRTTARLSRSAGTPDGLPDVVGLALRFHHEETGSAPSTFSDVLLSSTGWGFPSRFLMVPRRWASRGALTTMVPYRGSAGPVLVGARTLRPRRLPSSLSGFVRTLGEDPWQLVLFFASPRGRWHRFGTVTLRLDPEGEERDLRFDAVLHPLAGAQTYEWVRNAREGSYALSRRDPGDT